MNKALYFEIIGVLPIVAYSCKKKILDDSRASKQYFPKAVILASSTKITIAIYLFLSKRMKGRSKYRK